MKWAEAKELAGMLGILAVLVVTGAGVSSMAREATEVVDVPEVPAAESPSVTGFYEAVGPCGAAELPVGVPFGV